MGLILDSSATIAAERKGLSAKRFLQEVTLAFHNQEIALAAVGLTELVHGIYRADSPRRRSVRERFILDLTNAVSIYPYTAEMAFLAGRIWGEQQQQGIRIPYSDLLIGATALSLGFAVLTENLRDFRLIPDLTIISLTKNLPLV